MIKRIDRHRPSFRALAVRVSLASFRRRATARVALAVRAMLALCAFSTACVFLAAPVAAETIRERAEDHFAVTGWSVNTDIFASRDRNPVSVPGGNETFAAMTPGGESGLEAIYPEIGDLGALDYTGIDNSLLDALTRIDAQANERKIDASSCDPNRNFLAPVASYRLSKLPSVSSVWHSRPIVDGPDAAGVMKATSVVRLLCAGKGGATPLRMTVTLSLVSSTWLVEDISFDGKAYAALAQQN